MLWLGACLGGNSRSAKNPSILADDSDFGVGRPDVDCTRQPH
jgi:hypothetical protein